MYLAFAWRIVVRVLAAVDYLSMNGDIEVMTVKWLLFHNFHPSNMRSPLQVAGSVGYVTSIL